VLFFRRGVVGTLEQLVDKFRKPAPHPPAAAPPKPSP
jgi:hypothetical protein